MNITLTHKFLVTAHDLPGLLKDCQKLSTFCNRLEKQSILYPDRYDPENYKGDGLELFAEALIKLSPIDTRIGIAHYTVVEGVDTGVDGFGIGTNGRPATVQVKFRSNSEKMLTANEDHLSNFISASQNRYGVAIEDVNNMLIITTAKNLHPFTRDEMLYNKVRCLGYEQLRELVDNNLQFWNVFRQLCGVDF